MRVGRGLDIVVTIENCSARHGCLQVAGAWLTHPGRPGGAASRKALACVVWVAALVPDAVWAAGFQGEAPGTGETES